MVSHELIDLDKEAGKLRLQVQEEPQEQNAQKYTIDLDQAATPSELGASERSQVLTTLKDKIQQKFKRLEAHAEPAGRQLTVLLEDGRLQCQLLTRDSLGCAFHRLDYTSEKLADATPERLQQISQTLSEQLRYLLEPIRPIEVDQQGCSVQLRSEPPSKDEDGTNYYEVVVQRGGQIALCRYNKLPGQPRQLVPTQVTYQVLHRLAADLVAAVD